MAPHSDGVGLLCPPPLTCSDIQTLLLHVPPLPTNFSECIQVFLYFQCIFTAIVIVTKNLERVIRYPATAWACEKLEASRFETAIPSLSPPFSSINSLRSARQQHHARQDWTEEYAPRSPAFPSTSSHQSYIRVTWVDSRVTHFFFGGTGEEEQSAFIHPTYNLVILTVLSA